MVSSEVSYDSISYMTKSETHVEGPFFVGLDSYKSKMQPMKLQLAVGQQQLRKVINHPYKRFQEHIPNLHMVILYININF